MNLTIDSTTVSGLAPVKDQRLYLPSIEDRIVLKDTDETLLSKGLLHDTDSTNYSELNILLDFPILRAVGMDFTKLAQVTYRAKLALITYVQKLCIAPTTLC